MKKTWFNKHCLLLISPFALFLLSCAAKDKNISINNNDLAESKIVSSSVEPNNSTKPKYIHTPLTSNDLLPRGLDFANAPETIAFGSCANQDAPQPIWDVIAKSSPDLFLFTGDNVYASRPETKPFSIQYKKLNEIKEFRSFREKVPFLVTWDDHDYGVNDGGLENPEKEEAKKEFLNQWPYVKDSLRLKQGGIYHSKILGGVRKKSPTVQIILLDTRWFRTALNKVNDPAQPLRKFEATQDKNATLLGEEQWYWLEKQLLKPASVRIVVSSIQFIAEGHGFEKWGNFPKEKERFIELLKRTKAKNLFIISGDRHRGAIAKMDIKGWGPLFDITSSSINRPSNLEEEDPTYIGSQIKKENFGLASIDWSRKRISFELRDIENNIINKIETSIK